MKRNIFLSLFFLSLLSCSDSQSTSSQKDIDLVDPNSNSHRVVYLDGETVKLKTCASGPFNRNCAKVGEEQSISYDKFLASLSALFGILPFHPSEQGIKDLEAIKNDLRIEIGTGNLPAHEQALAERQLKELDHKKEGIGRVIFFLKQIRQGELARITSFRREFRLVEAAVKFGHTVAYEKLGDNKFSQIMYLGSGPKWEARQRCGLLGGYPMPGNYGSMVSWLRDLFEAFPVDIEDEDGKVTGQTMGIGYWAGRHDFVVLDAKSGNLLPGAKTAERLAIVCFVEGPLGGVN